jgi:hypothetical protein
VETPKQKGKIRRKKPDRPNKPKEQEGMPRHQHCPPTMHREDKNPKYHEEQHKDVALILAPHPPKTVEREQKYIDERNAACGHNFYNAISESPLHP